ncbi:MAG: hypothetical protein LUG49_03475 [Oscillospiraceae bacterium]|nr:hypothetical protein [Oscillospiraceae bacterium]
MMQVNLSNPMEIQIVGMKALKEALGPVGAVRFIQQNNPGYGDYTKERQARPDVDPDEAIAGIHEFKQKKQQGLL